MDCKSTLKIKVFVGGQATYTFYVPLKIASDFPPLGIVMENRVFADKVLLINTKSPATKAGVLKSQKMGFLISVKNNIISEGDKFH